LTIQLHHQIIKYITIVVYFS